MSLTADPSRSGAPVEAPPAPLTAQQVEELLALLGKSARAYQMYLANNPVYHRFVEGMRRVFVALWDRVPSLELTIDERGMSWQGEIVMAADARDDLSRQFYKDGIRRLAFLPGFEDELERFLSVLHRARLAAAEEDDLVTLLWEQDFHSLRYGYVDFLAEGLHIPDGPEGVPAPISPEAIAADVAEDESSGAERAPGTSDAFSREDFKETLYFLDEDELATLQAEVEAEWSRDLRSAVLNALFDRLEDPIPERQDEILSILRQLLPNFLSRGELRSAATVLRELDAIRAMPDVLGAAQVEAVEGLFGELSMPEALEQLIRALEDGAIHPDSEELALFLAHLRPDALPVLIRAAENSNSAAVQERMRGAIGRLGAQHPARLIALIGSSDPVEAAGAAHIAGNLRLVEAVPQLTRLLTRAEASCRLAAVEALVAVRSASALNALQDALEDPVREVRIAAARGLGALRYAPAASRLEEIVNGRAIRNADLTEKLAVFDAYALAAGNDAIPVLEKLLHGRGRLGRKLPAELRACAATALGRIETPAARAALEAASDDDEPIVRGAIQRALRREVTSS